MKLPLEHKAILPKIQRKRLQRRTYEPIPPRNKIGFRLERYFKHMIPKGETIEYVWKTLGKK